MKMAEKMVELSHYTHCGAIRGRGGFKVSIVVGAAQILVF